MRNSKAFTLIEIIVAVALVAILSAAIAPSVLNNIAQGRIARATSDVQALSSAVARFRKDTGLYPNKVNPSFTSTEFNFLATRGPDGDPSIATTALQYWARNATTGVPAAPVWPTAFTATAGAASCQDITSHLIEGQDRVDSSYSAAQNPDDPLDVGFRAGLISNDPLDPWGHRYLINVAGLGVTREPVWVISAGPDGILDTYVPNTGLSASDSLRGDDIGFRVQ
ncbi:MAG: prepilin-type N-terminal cleavage/methylation domain-containing protein [Candidatus Glassbacteria bacterium]|nr:prepilin-type N-terminal cleavage/methylation domain-containing protein [Candidatus Glassbacteria bacterium]